MKESHESLLSKRAINSSRRNTQDSNEEVKLAMDHVPTWTSARYGLAYMSFFGFFVVYALRVNLSVAIVSMVNSTNDEKQNVSNECPSTSVNKTSSEKTGEFNWTADEKALVLGAFFYGYICTQILGGFLAGRFGGKYLFGGGVLCTTVLTLFTPLAARTNFTLLIVTRVLEGIGEGVTFPAMHAMWGFWCPPLERSKLLSLGYAGGTFGTVVAQPISGVLCASTFLGGWPSVFYVFGTIGLVWCLLWFLLIHNKPADHPRISEAELRYIQSTVSQEQTTSVIPWISIITSLPVWGIIAAQFANNWGFYTLLTCLPLYLKNIMGFDISENGLIAALPYFVMWVMINVSGFLADTVRERGILTTTQTRKVCNALGLLMPAVFLVSSVYVGCNNALSIAFICLANAFGAFNFSGFNPNIVDIAPRYAGIIMGISNTIGTIPGFVTPLVVQELTGDNETREQWRYVFFISAGIYVFGTIIFTLFATGKEQDWNRPFHVTSSKAEDEERRPLLSKDGGETARI